MLPCDSNVMLLSSTLNAVNLAFLFRAFKLPTEAAGVRGFAPGHHTAIASVFCLFAGLLWPAPTTSPPPRAKSSSCAWSSPPPSRRSVRLIHRDSLFRTSSSLMLKEMRCVLTGHQRSEAGHELSCRDPSGTVCFQALMSMMIMKQITPVYMYKVLPMMNLSQIWVWPKQAKSRGGYYILTCWSFDFPPDLSFRTFLVHYFFMRFLRFSLTYLLS